jgi:2-methylcitrate dehydratase PrpD
LGEFTDAALDDARLRNFHAKVTMRLDSEVDQAYPKRWIGKVEIETRDGRKIAQRVDTPKGDPGNTLSRAELEDKALRLGRYAGGADDDELHQLIKRVWTLRSAPNVRDFLGNAGQ